MASMLKVLFLGLGVLLVELAITPPIPPAQEKKGDKVLSTSSKSFEKYVLFWTAAVRHGSSGLFLLEAILLVVQYFEGEHWIPNKICPATLPEAKLSTMSSLFILGMTGVYLGGILRLWCFQTLGNMFTFEVSIRPNHKLITHGPYAIVRHPSYLGSAVCVTGIIIAEYSPNSYLNGCGIFATYPITKWIFYAWAVTLEWVLYSLTVARPPVEDRNLQATFGKEWEEYRERVPYKVIPGIF